ncbi:MAG: GNAT family N-acetyltransferase [Candidatus Lokiarchaeota archaeon]|nr:GNAT family N-acetyltransferase [Candidatus Lokiarchaeota archaeon]
MSYSTRLLTIEDKEQVEAISATIWDGHDYVGRVFPKWVEDEDSVPVGVFDDSKLIGIINIQFRKLGIAWAQGLRVLDDYRDKGVGTKLTKEIVKIAKEKGARILRYCTSSRNEASIHVAKKAGFYQANRVGYLRLYPPYPDHPKPSPLIHPVKLDSDRMMILLNQNPDLVPTKTLPIAWEFETKDMTGIEKIADMAEIKGIVSHNGILTSFYYSYEFTRDDEKQCAFTVYSIDRSEFVDIISRILDTAETKGYKRIVFFLGPNGTEWMDRMDLIPEEYEGRRFILFELIPSEH